MRLTTIRPATETDWPAMRALLATHDMQAEGVTYARFTGLVLVADDGGEVVGFCQMLPGHPVAVLIDVAVAPDRIGEGLGSRLLREAERVLALAGIQAWWTATDRAWSQRVLDGWPGCRRQGQAIRYVRGFDVTDADRSRFTT